MAERKARKLDITIKGERAVGKTSVLWVLLQQLETFGATVSLPNNDEHSSMNADRHVRMLRDRPHPFRPGDFTGLHVNITTETVEGEDDA